MVIGAEGFAEGSRRELLATGERVRSHTADTRAPLTAREAQIARWPAMACPTPRSRPGCS